RHPREERDVRVPILDRARFAEAKYPAPVFRKVDLLVRQREAHAAALFLAREPEHSDFSEQLERRRSVPRVEVGLHLCIRELRPAPYQRSLDLDIHTFS